MGEKRDWVMRPRNVHHPNWVNKDHNLALQIIDTLPVNTVLFRPSKRHDLLVAMLKVRETRGEKWVTPTKCFRTFEVYERGPKDTTAGFFDAPDDSTIFYLTYCETTDSMRPGALVRCTVQEDQEYPEKVAEAKGLALKDMRDPKAEVKVKVLPHMIRGTFRKRDKGSLEAEAFKGCDRFFATGEQVIARIERIYPRNSRLGLSVDMDLDVFEKNFPVREELDAVFFVPFKEEEISDRANVCAALYDFSSKDKRMMYYSFVLNDAFPGHATLLWALGGQHVREEFIEVSPKGYSLWTVHFETLRALLQWFKLYGWRNAAKCRVEFKQYWESKRKKAIEKRGEDVREGEKGDFGGYESRLSSGGLTSGLRTPTSAAPVCNATTHACEPTSTPIYSATAHAS